MANQDQLDELASVECIYAGSEEVLLELPDPAEDHGRGALELRMAAHVVVEGGSRRSVDFAAWLPASYLGERPAERPPRFELASASLGRPQLEALRGQLDVRLAEWVGGPVLFECIEWLRTESWTFLGSAALADGATARDGDDISHVSQHPADAAPAASHTCANCACALDAASEPPCWGGCGHALCGHCAGDVVQVHGACGAAPRCPLPECREPLPEAVVDSAGAPQRWASVGLRLRGTIFEESVVYCPRCEDLGRDVPVLTTLAAAAAGGDEEAGASRPCRCYACSWRFCDICRSPWHPGQSCFDDESRVVRMAKRRPPLTAELAEAAARVAEEARRREKNRAERLRDGLMKGSGRFHALREAFLDVHFEAIMHGLRAVFGGDVALEPASIAPAVQERFLSALRAAAEAQLRPAFHGTDARNHASIFERGLLVPGEQPDIRVVNGQAHGRGVYTANVDAAWLSKGFCSEPKMLICAVIDSGEVVRHVGDAMVVARSDHVVPLFEGASGSFSGECGHSRWAASPPAARPPPPAQVPPPPAAAKAPASGARGGAADASGKAGSRGKDGKRNKFLSRLAARANRH